MERSWTRTCSMPARWTMRNMWLNMINKYGLVAILSWIRRLPCGDCNRRHACCVLRMRRRRYSSIMGRCHAPMRIPLLVPPFSSMQRTGLSSVAHDALSDTDGERLLGYYENAMARCRWITFIPMLMGTGGNCGFLCSTQTSRACCRGAEARDILRVFSMKSISPDLGGAAVCGERNPHLYHV